MKMRSIIFVKKSTTTHIASNVKQHKISNNKISKEFDFYKLFWIFIVGSILGVFIETLWGLIKYQEIQNRSGLILGPFNLIYGLGAVFMSLGLYWLKKYNNFVVWLGGFFVGSIIEYFCSWFQEVFFGSMSWNYENIVFNLHGRINLIYSVFWGLLGVFWIRICYPFLSNQFIKISKKFIKPFTWILFLFMILNITFSGLAVSRWYFRVNDYPATTRMALFFDSVFPNERMEILYPNLFFIESENVL